MQSRSENALKGRVSMKEQHGNGRALARVACAASLVAAAAAFAAGASDAARVERVLAATPLVDGHNDLPWEIRERFGGIAGVDLAASLAKLPRKADGDEIQSAIQTDLPRLRAGHVGGQ